MNKVEKYELAEKLDKLELFKTFIVENDKCSSRKDGVHIYSSIMNEFTNDKPLNKTQTKKQELNQYEYVIFMRRMGNKSIITFLRSWEKTHEHKHLIVCFDRDRQWICENYKCPFCKKMRIECNCITKIKFSEEESLVWKDKKK